MLSSNKMVARDLIFFCPFVCSYLKGLPISTYAKFCHRKLQKVAITGGKKVSNT